MGDGFRVFATGEVVTAAQVNGYLMEQAVMTFASAAARTAAVATPEEGMVSYLTDTNLLYFYDGSAWSQIPATVNIRKNSAGTVYARPRVNFIEGGNVTLTVVDDGSEVDVTIAAAAGASAAVIKSADESVSASTTLQDDNELLLPLLANTDYTFTAWLHITMDRDFDIKVAFTVPAAASISWAGIHNNDAATPATLPLALVTASGTSTTLLGQTSGATNVHTALLSGTVRTGANAGNLTLQFAQGTSGANASTVKAGSSLRVDAGT